MIPSTFIEPFGKFPCAELNCPRIPFLLSKGPDEEDPPKIKWGRPKRRISYEEQQEQEHESVGALAHRRPHQKLTCHALIGFH